eukprot:m.310550 g.310550  ORF g.310550 m.310550 type:complete len:493 (+) comp52522_c0_seq1:84-1562(+)
MFYAEVVLGRKGPLARVWLAAHSEKKLTKAQVIETNIGASVDAILTNKYNLALRTSSHLLIGIVRIYDRKITYLLADIREALAKVKRGLRPAAIDRPQVNIEAAAKAVTLPDDFYDDEFDMPLLPTEENGVLGDLEFDDGMTMHEEPSTAFKTLEEMMEPDLGDPSDMNKFLEAEESKEAEKSKDKSPDVQVSNIDDIPENNFELTGLDNFGDIQPDMLTINEEAEEQHLQNEKESEAEHLDLDIVPPAKRRCEESHHQQVRKNRLFVDDDLEVDRGVYRAWLADTSNLIEEAAKPGPSPKKKFRRECWPRDDILSHGVFTLNDRMDDVAAFCFESREDGGDETTGDILPQLDDIPVFDGQDTFDPSVDPVVGGEQSSLVDNSEVELPDENDGDENAVREGVGSEEVGTAELEEKLWSRTNKQMVELLRRKIGGSDEERPASFFQLAKHHTQLQAAAKFYSLLVLSRNKFVHLEQKKAYGDIAIKRGNLFEN